SATPNSTDNRIPNIVICPSELVVIRRGNIAECMAHDKPLCSPRDSECKQTSRRRVLFRACGCGCYWLW
ncbi:MAG: hypothetical protein AAB325_01485, partial [Pseudomonadota bacterium]